ncbi:MAG: NAD(P)-dependent oxidoreductase [Gaiellaceae bacterium]
MNRVLVTGASGFVGRFAVKALTARGFEVHGVARRPEGTIEASTWYQEDLLEPEAARRLMRVSRPSHLLHLAWTTTHGRYWDDQANLDWVAATRRLVDAFTEAGGARMVITGSCAQYDWTVDEEMAETETPRRPATLYGQAKESATRLFEASQAEGAPSSATALLFFPYGPFEAPERLVPSVTLSLLAGEEARTTAGAQVRDFVHVADCGAALAALVDGHTTGAVNVGSGQGTTVADVARTLARLVEREELLRIGALPGDDGTHVVAETTRLRKEVGFAPRYGLEDGLRDAVEWWRQRTRRR